MLIHGIFSSISDNVGDDVQTLAVERLMGGLDGYLDRENISREQQESGLLIANGWWKHRPNEGPPPSSITPVYTGFHLHYQHLIQGEWLEHFKRHSPIGCRDSRTLEWFQAASVPAYLSNCLTLTLERWLPQEQEALPLVIDLAAGLLPNLPHVQITHQMQGDSHPRRIRALTLASLSAMQRAPMVITSRLQVALPCLAFGTPVVFTTMNPEDERFSELAKLVPFASLTQAIQEPERHAYVMSESRRIALQQEIRAEFFRAVDNGMKRHQFSLTQAERQVRITDKDSNQDALNQSSWCLIQGASVGCGECRADGTLGFSTPLTNRVTIGPQTSDAIVISAHAPSKITINLSSSARVQGWLSASSNWRPESPVVFSVNGAPIGMLTAPMSSSREISLPPGRVILRADTTQRDSAHSAWVLTPEKESTIPRLAVVTSAFYPEEHAWRKSWHLSQSLMKRGLRLHPCGIGQEFKSFLHGKVRVILDYVRNLTEEFVLFTDCRDSIIIADEEEIISKFLGLNTGFLVSMERGCWPVHHSEWESQFPDAPDKRRWPNSGGWMGHREAVINVLEACITLSKQLSSGKTKGLANRWQEILSPYFLDDQLLMQVLYLEGSIQGDVKGEIFTNLGTAESRLVNNSDYEVEGSRLIHSNTKTKPAVVHFSGPTCDKAFHQWAGVLGIHGDNQVVS